MRTRWTSCSASGLVLALAAVASAQTPLGTAFTYQGRLSDSGVPPTGAYDLQFRLFDAVTAGTQVGGTVTLPSVAVTGGLFTVRLDFGAAAFAGSARWLEIGVRPGGSPNPFTILSPRQELTPTPDAIFSSAVPWSGIIGKPAGFADDIDNDSGGDITGVTAGTGLSGGGSSGSVSLSVDTAVIQSRVTGTCAPGGSIQTVNENGSVTCQPDTTGNDWALTGNLGTNPAVNFLGTQDPQALELRVGGARALRLEPGPVPSVVGGHAANSALSIGAAIGGGGDSGSPNIANGPWATIGGGHGNAAFSDATVGGGVVNKATGAGSTVPGGMNNEAGGSASFAAGQGARVRSGDDGTFVWADSAGGLFTSTGANQFLVRSAGGVGINTEDPDGDLQLGRPGDATAFRFGNAGARHHLISNRDMVFNAYDGNGVLDDSSVFLWRRNFVSFNENSFLDLMTLSDTGFLSLFGNAFIAGDVNVGGTLTKGGGSFRIDHPLDPRNKYLSHSFVESPDMMNIYNGNVTTGADGFATVELAEWFEALNRDFRYQLTVVGTGAWARARVAREIEHNRFVVETDVPGTRVSWQVTGIRRDAWAEKHRIRVEEDKPRAERGHYLHPDVHAQPVMLQAVADSK